MRQAIVVLTAALIVLTAGAAFALMISGQPAEEIATDTSTTTSVRDRSENGDSDSGIDKANSRESEEKDGEKSEKESDKKSDKTKKESDEKVSDDENRKESEEEGEKGKAPELAVVSPQDGKHFTEDHVTFEGEVTPGSKVFAGKWEADVSEDGQWRIVLILDKGENTVRFTAIRKGQEAQDQVTVYLDAKEEPKQETEFSAHQKYGSCDAEVPYDVWYGTGKPGTKVFVAADYGSASTSVGENGKWEVKVKFPDAPCGKQFKVVLETNQGHREVYEFVRFCEKGQDGGEEGQGEK